MLSAPLRCLEGKHPAAPGQRPRLLVLGVAWLMSGLLPAWVTAPAVAQSVGLPAPRLLTIFPLGGQAGTTVEVKVTGEHLDGADQLLFRSEKLVATPKLDAAGRPLPLEFRIQIAPDTPPGLYEGHLQTRLGLSSSRVFSVGSLPEIVQKQPNTKLDTAQLLTINTVCNAVMTARQVDHYTFEGQAGQRLTIECSSRGIDSKLDAVVALADDKGRDLLVERQGGLLDVRLPRTGRFFIKVHGLTFQGGESCQYRLTLRELAEAAPLSVHHSTRGVSAFSWPPRGLPEQAPLSEAQPEDPAGTPQVVELPCDIAGAFYPANDLDVFEFTGRKGEEWWVEVASERLGRPTDVSVVVELLGGEGANLPAREIAQFQDIASPIKVSSNGYAYDGPPYHAGSPDVLGKLVLPEDGRYRLSLTDLFGGTRSDRRNVYRLIVRRPDPDFSVVAWPLHMELRNGDRAALSKPLSLRGGATHVLEVVAIRRDGYQGPIDLELGNLPPGVRAQGLRLAAGQNRGLIFVTAAADVARGFQWARLIAKGQVGDEERVNTGHLATVAWPIPDSWGEIPAPRLSADIPVSAGGVDLATITIAPAAGPVVEAVAGTKVTVPFNVTRRSEFSGATASLRPVGAGFESAAVLEVPLSGDSCQATLDLAALKLPPGTHTLGFVGYAVARYRHHPEAIETARLLQEKAQQLVKQLGEQAQQAAGDSAALAIIEPKQKEAAAALAAATAQLKQATDTAAPRDVVDIIATEPVQLKVTPAN
ncbi:MAG: serine protease [Planctomycetaceae bacterium]